MVYLSFRMEKGYFIFQKNDLPLEMLREELFYSALKRINQILVYSTAHY